jgi:hypothetical protein
VPLPRPATPVGGGHVAIFQQGVARPALHVDVTSLYPSVMLSLAIGPAAGGVLAIRFGYSSIAVMGLVCFVISLMLLSPLMLHLRSTAGPGTPVR